MYFSSPTYTAGTGTTAGTSAIDCRRSHLVYMNSISKLGDESNPPCSTGGTIAPPPPPPNGCTTVSGADPGKTCVFPFRFNGVLYNECTLNGNAPGETEPWCSTLTDSNDNHQGGQGRWGFCSSDCPGISSTTPAPTTTDAGPTGPGECGKHNERNILQYLKIHTRREFQNIKSLPYSSLWPHYTGYRRKLIGSRKHSGWRGRRKGRNWMAGWADVRPEQEPDDSLLWRHAHE